MWDMNVKMQITVESNMLLLVSLSKVQSTLHTLLESAGFVEGQVGSSKRESMLEQGRD